MASANEKSRVPFFAAFCTICFFELDFDGSVISDMSLQSGYNLFFTISIKMCTDLWFHFSKFIVPELQIKDPTRKMINNVFFSFNNESVFNDKFVFVFVFNVCAIICYQ